MAHISFSAWTILKGDANSKVLTTSPSCLVVFGQQWQIKFIVLQDCGVGKDDLTQIELQICIDYVNSVVQDEHDCKFKASSTIMIMTMVIKRRMIMIIICLNSINKIHTLSSYNNWQYQFFVKPVRRIYM